MGMCSAIGRLCCTIEGLRWLKKSFSFIVGGAFITIAVLSFLFGGFINPVTMVRAVWNVVFGILMIFLQFGKTKWVITRFGFLGHWVGRALFYLFCGTNILVIDQRGGFCIWCFISWVVGGMCMFVGLLEIIFGCRCEAENERLPKQQQNAASANPAFGQPSAMEPSVSNGRGKPLKTKGTFSNVFAPSGGGCQVDPSGGGPSTAEPSFTVNMAGGGGGATRAAAPAAGGGVDNPFFGNAHLST
mmetsp:Transcript_31693/g.102356  ORF Transcript_31693/g.102356 Transcript_31693/m.102356 type:complete len:244 (+) Transcript_31693:104-835(+)